MRKSPTHDIEQWRITTGPMASRKRDGANGAFVIPGPLEEPLKIVCSDGTEWDAAGLPRPAFEHVSVSCMERCPVWREMDYVKSIFWRDDECVIQYHVPRSEHVNCHPCCLHLWKPIGVEIPRPPASTVGPGPADRKKVSVTL